VIVDSTPDPGVCKVSDATLKTEAEFVIQQSRLKLVEASKSHARLVIQLAILSLGTPGSSTGCAAAVSAQLVAPIAGTTNWSNTTTAQATFWSSTRILAAQPERFASLADKIVTDTVKLFVVEWAKQN
jgi:hypothetical protein